jgi:hypothetical protein
MATAVSDLATLKPIDLDSVEEELRVSAAIEERLAEDTVKDDHDLSFANQVSERLGSLTSIAVRDVSARLAYQQNQAIKACEGLDFESEKNEILSLQSEIRVAIGRDEDDLKYDFELFQRSLQHFDQYRSERRLIAPARRSEAPLTLAATLTGMALVEAVFNAIFLAPVDPAGMIWGVLTAILIAMINVGVGFTIGYGIKLVNSVKPHAKVLGWLIAAAGIPLLLLFHYLVMKYRAEMSLVGEEIEAGGEYLTLSELFIRTWESILTNPANVGDMISFVVFIVGVGIALFAVKEGYSIGDPYPGYTSAQARFEANRTSFIDRRNHHLDDLQDLRDRVIGQIDGFIREADAGKTKAINWAQQSRTLLQSYRTFRTSIDNAASVITERYVGSLKGREKSAVRKLIAKRLAQGLTQDTNLEALVADVCRAAETGAEDANSARQQADELRAETIAAIDRQIAEFKEKFDR